MLRTLVLIATLVAACPTWSFTCYYTLVKDSCWSKYNVSVDVIDSKTSKTILTASAPAGTPWVRNTFECTPAQGLLYLARFSPIFWQNDEGKSYRGKRSWLLPGTINPGDTAWTITVCYPSDFSEVPLPPDAVGNCACDFSVIPEVTPRVK